MNCHITVTCSSPKDGKCARCKPGYYLKAGTPDTCVPCEPVAGCDVVTCSTEKDSTCSGCTDGYFKSPTAPGGCAVCTNINGCDSTVMCTNANDSRCTKCAHGYFLTNATGAMTSDTCTVCHPPTGECSAFVSCSSAEESVCNSCPIGFYDDNVTKSCTSCTPIAACASPLYCVNSTSSQCTKCSPGYWLNETGTADVCSRCTSVPECATPVMCTSASNSKCSSCVSGYYLNNTVSPSVCTPCPSISGCSTSITCTGPDDVHCSSCSDGYFPLVKKSITCQACTPITGCASAVKCTNDKDSVCKSCVEGRFLDTGGMSDLCTVCTPVARCLSHVTINCTSNINSQCTKCVESYYRNQTLSADQCLLCPPVDGCTSVSTCNSSLTGSTCTSNKCVSGYYLNRTRSGDICEKCTAVEACSSPINCTNNADSYCVSCSDGFYLKRVPGKADVCEACPKLAGCAGATTCTSDTTRTCDECAFGYYNKSGECAACTKVPNCRAAVNCTNANDSYCEGCLESYYRVANGTSFSCFLCPGIAGCNGAVTCTNEVNRQCRQCSDGFYLKRTEGAPDQCIRCTAVPGCLTEVTCSSSTRSKCKSCLSGFFNETDADGGDHCTSCPPIPGCVSPVVCESKDTPKCIHCAYGFWLDNSTSAHTCEACTPITACASSIECTGPDDSICSDCSAGYYLDIKNKTHECLPCTPVDNCATTLSCSNASDTTCESCSKGFDLKHVVGSMDTCEVNTNCTFEAWGSWSECGFCKGGSRRRYRGLMKNSTALAEFCYAASVDTVVCGFPCVEPTITSLESVALYIYQSLTDYDWLSLQYGTWAKLKIASSTYGVQISVTMKSDEEIAAEAEEMKRQSSKPDCMSLAADISETVLTTSWTVLPNISRDFYLEPNITSMSADECLVVLGVTPPNKDFLSGSIVGIVVGVVAAVLLIAAIVLLIFYKKFKGRLDLSRLPPDVRVFYEQYFKSPSSWTKEGLGDVVWYRKQLMPGSDLYSRMSEIFDNYCQGKDLIISDAHLIYNPVLVNSFLTQVNVIKDRMDMAPLFVRRKSVIPDNPEARALRQWVHGKFMERSRECPWYAEDIPIILPAVHGTSLDVAWKICATGFAALSILDDGFFGKGMYFTTFATYALPYFSKKSDPAIILSFVLPGVAFPVIEHPKSPKSYVGKPLESGCNSHYIVTCPDGNPPADAHQKNIYDELVVLQEAQITPFAILKIDRSNLPHLLKKFGERTVVSRVSF
eukprot:TRINITY_DN513_c0_g1_i2.p1 TRINITY_DN513_c0_g1~~TRINITY_DN513_c0_g1_i2.p1  ORF type:complete len:1241 (+),score=206.88 TRINITY_DN513_c0_g1_i2:2442-6164(+)